MKNLDFSIGQQHLEIQFAQKNLILDVLCQLNRQKSAL